MNAIPPSKAKEARHELEQRNKEIHEANTSFKLKLLDNYKDYCDPSKKIRLQKRIDELRVTYKKQNIAEDETQDAHNKAYSNQIIQTLKELQPGAKL